MQIRLFNPFVCEEAIAAASEVMRSGWLGMGPRVAAFEQAFAAYLGVRHAVALNTCTSALHLALLLLNAPAGGEVITTPNTFVATNQAILWAGLKPVFADIDPTTGNLDPKCVKARLSERTVAIMTVHFGGNPCDLEGLRAVAGKTLIIEDCAHACGASYQGKRVGASGNLCAFSFGATKNLTTGDGGMLIVPSETQAGVARQMRYLGLSKDTFRRVTDSGGTRPHWEYEVQNAGLRYHMNDLAGALGVEQLKHLDADNARRAEIAGLYQSRLQRVSGVKLLREVPGSVSSHYLFCILVEGRDALAAALMSRGIVVGVHYQPNTHYGLFDHVELPQAEEFYRRELSLPMHLGLTEEEVMSVCDAIEKGW